MMKEFNNQRYIAGITTYQPKIRRLRQNIEAISRQVDKVLIVDNGSDSFSEIELLAQNYENVAIVNNNDNKGIAYAMNVIGDYAYSNCYDWFLTLDQDSVCPENLITEYSKLIGPDIGIIAPYVKFNERFVSQLFRRKKVDVNRFEIKQNVEEVLYAVSSGQFINTHIWKEADGFWNYLFIDYVDQEFCFHVRSLGYKILRANNCELNHEPGIPMKVLGIPTAKQSTIREYYCSRNSRLVYWLYKKEFLSIIPHRPFLLTFKRMANVILVREDVFHKLYSIFKGIVDAYKWRYKNLNKGRMPANSKKER